MKNNVKEWKWPVVEKAHTYASENANVYRAFDAGQEDMLRRFNKSKKDGKIWVAVDRKKLSETIAKIYQNQNFRVTNINAESFLGIADAIIERLGGKR